MFKLTNVSFNKQSSVYFQKLLVWMNVHDHWEDNIGKASTKQ